MWAFNPAPAQQPAKLDPAQQLLKGKPTEFKYLFANHMKKAEHKHEAAGEDFLRRYQTQYIRPRAFPKGELDFQNHIKARANLQKMRVALKRPHIRAGFMSHHAGAKGGTKGPAGGPTGGPAGGPSGGPTSDTAWTSLGPTNINGRITTIAIDPNNNQHIFATTVGGVWRSFDGARRWERASDDFLTGVCACVAVNPGNGNEVLVGTGDPNYATAFRSAGGNGIWHSTSSGDPGSWSKITPAALDNQTIFRIRFDPASPNNAYVATSAGLYLGTHSGGTYSFARLKGFDAWTTDFVVDFSATPRVVYAGVAFGSATYAAGVWKYDGSNWNKRDSGITAGGRTICLAMSASSPKTLYARLEKASNGRLLGVFKTTTGGETPAGGGSAWANLAGAFPTLDDSIFSGGGGYCWYNSVIEVDPVDPNTVYCVGVGIYRSTTGGTSWSSIAGGADPAFPIYTHGDNHSIVFDPKNSKNLYIGTDGGVYHAENTFGSTWHWNDVSHGMVVTQFYRIASQQAAASIIAGGSQDNGTEITFGNRTWYHPAGCDGNDVGIDASDSLTVYMDCNGGLFEMSNPVPGTTGYGTSVSWTAPTGYTPVGTGIGGQTQWLVTDPGKAGAALANGGAADPSKPVVPRLLKTTDGKAWTFASPALPSGDTISCIAIAPSSAFQTYYLGTTGATPTIWRTTTGGTNWATTATGLPSNVQPNAIAIDYTNPNRAVAGFGGYSGGKVSLTTDGGATWHGIDGTGANALPANNPITAIVFDPSDANTVYAGSTVGVFKGTITPGATPTGSWVPFDEGLPNAVDVTDMFVNRATGVLKIGTFGYGAYRRDIKPGVKNPAVMLVVRDNVFDRGQIPSTPAGGFPDPENPVADPARPGFFKPGPAVYWWASSDIRIDVPSLDPPANTIASADHVEFESTPLHIAPALPGTLLDSDPQRGKPAKVYIQVANNGLQPATKVRVMALWADASAGLPLLPKDFWTRTFTAAGSACGPLSASSGWHFPDPANPCKVIPVINPIMPEVVEFDWNVPANAASHTCMLAIVDTIDDPIESSIRSANEVRPWVFIPNSRHIGLRNLHIVGVAPNQPHNHMLIVNVPNPHANKHAVELHIDAHNLHAGGQVGVILPTNTAVQSKGVAVKALELKEEHKAAATKLQLDHTKVHVMSEKVGHFTQLPVPAGKTIKVALVIQGGNATPGTAHQVTIITRDGNTVLGGSTFILRVPAQ
jgi:hypothetical protein